VALQLKRRGIDRIRPLAGGLEGWRERQFPVDSIPVTTAAAVVAPAERAANLSK
jgi:3-mercaptopyruvate sulfurtransferase SseA